MAFVSAVEAARDPEALVETLEALAECKDPEVKAALASNLRTPPWMLSLFALDRCKEVVLAAASNPGTPADFLQLLIKQVGHFTPEQQKQLHAAPNHPMDYLRELCRINHEVALRLARNPSTPMYLLADLAHVGDAELRKAVASNPNISRVLLGVLSCDPVLEVCEEAVANPRWRTRIAPW